MCLVLCVGSAMKSLCLIVSLLILLVHGSSGRPTTFSDTMKNSGFQQKVAEVHQRISGLRQESSVEELGDLIWQTVELTLTTDLDDVRDTGVGELSLEQFHRVHITAAGIVAYLYNMIEPCEEETMPRGPMIFAGALMGIGVTQPFTGPLSGVLYDQMAFSIGQDEAEYLYEQLWPILQNLDDQVYAECLDPIEILQVLPDGMYAYETLLGLGSWLWGGYQDNIPTTDYVYTVVYGMLYSYQGYEYPGCINMNGELLNILNQTIAIRESFSASATNPIAFIQFDASQLDSVDANYRDQVETILADSIQIYVETMIGVLDLLEAAINQFNLGSVSLAPLAFIEDLVPYMFVSGMTEPTLQIMGPAPAPNVGEMSVDELMQELLQQYALQQELLLEDNLGELLSGIIDGIREELSITNTADVESFLQGTLGNAVVALTGSMGSSEVEMVIENEPDFGN